MSVTSMLSSLSLEAKPGREVMDVFHLSLMDWSAVGIAGKSEPVAKIMHDQAIEEAGVGRSGIIGIPGCYPARMAALANGTISHALDYDDTHFAHIGHPSVAVIPAALAIGQHVGADGSAFQNAAIVGMEASVRIGVWLGRSHYQAGYHQTATAGAFGATIASSRLLELDSRQLEMAIGLVSTRASGLKSQFGSMGKSFNAGIAAANGVESALLAERGFISASEALEGQNGFGLTHFGEDERSAFDSIYLKWVLPDVKHKFHACCHGLHAALEALSSFEGSTAEIAKASVFTHSRWMSVCNIAVPKTGLEAKFSYKTVVAMKLLEYDTAQMETYCDELCKNEAVMELSRKVEVIPDDKQTELSAAITITMNSGEVRRYFHDLGESMETGRRRKKTLSKAQSLIGRELAERLWDMIVNHAPPDELSDYLSK
ncbi:MAG: MmgE/PrpD family protein [Roseovarius sp.]|nr:MmgE/PrpD family protein [Roseovarius sp.]